MAAVNEGQPLNDPEPPPLTENQLAAVEWAKNAVGNRLPTIRTVAQDWQKTISTLIGLFGAATVLNADDAVTKLQGYWAYIYGLLVLGAIVAAAIAIAKASVAGAPRHVPISAAIEQQVVAFNDAFQSAASQLSCSKRCTGVAIGFLVLSLGVRWYAPHLATPAK